MKSFAGTNAAFKSWLRSWDPTRDNLELDACVARHPAGKRLGVPDVKPQR